MQVTYLLLFSWVIILYLGFNCSANHIFKSSLSCLIALLLTFTYVYVERQFDELISFEGMTSFFYYKFIPLFSSLNLPDAKIYTIAQGLYLFIIFLLLDLLCFVIFSINVFGRSPSRSQRYNFANIMFLVIYIFSWGTFSTVFSLEILPILDIEVGFLSPLFDWISEGFA